MLIDTGLKDLYLYSVFSLCCSWFATSTLCSAILEVRIWTDTNRTKTKKDVYNPTYSASGLPWTFRKNEIIPGTTEMPNLIHVCWS
jgi:hypothetical protein